VSRNYGGRTPAATNRGAVALGSIGVLRLLHEAAGAKIVVALAGDRGFESCFRKASDVPVEIPVDRGEVGTGRRLGD
jgi:hypothetical protein